MALTFLDKLLSEQSLAVVIDMSLELELASEIDQALVAEGYGAGSIDTVVTMLNISIEAQQLIPTSLCEIRMKACIHRCSSALRFPLKQQLEQRDGAI